MKLAIRIDHNLEMSSIDLDSGNTLKLLQGAVGGFIECVSLEEDFEFYCHEEGLYHYTSAEYNPLASSLMAAKWGQGYIQGPVIFTGGVDDEGDTKGLTPERAAQVSVLRESMFALLN